MENGVVVSNGNQVSTALALSPETLEALVLGGDLSRLSPVQKVEYYRVFCNRVGLDPATQPFKLMTFQGKQILYCDRGGTAQLNKKHEISHKIVERKRDEDIYSVIAQASTKDGRATESIGAVSVSNLKGDALCNAMMKAETKAKRRSTLDLMGLGMLDESEIETMPGAATAEVVSSVPHGTSIPPEERIETRPGTAPAVGDEIRKRWIQLRGKFNQGLLKCKTMDAIKTMEAWAEKNLGENCWTQFTYHNDFETFGSLRDQHKERVWESTKLERPEGMEQWIKSVSKCNNPRDLAGWVRSYRDHEELLSADSRTTDALQTAAQNCGLKSYTDVEKQEEAA